MGYSLQFKVQRLNLAQWRQNLDKLRNSLRTRTPLNRSSSECCFILTPTQVPQGKQVPILLSSVAATTYSLLSDLTATDAPLTKSLREISAILRKHYEPKPKRSTSAERFHFHKREQAAGESITEFEAALRKLTFHCDFEEYLEQALRDHLVCGLHSVTIQRWLLAEPELTHTKAMELAQAAEAAELNTKSFKP